MDGFELSLELFMDRFGFRARNKVEKWFQFKFSWCLCRRGSLWHGGDGGERERVEWKNTNAHKVGFDFIHHYSMRFIMEDVIGPREVNFWNV